MEMVRIFEVTYKKIERNYNQCLWKVYTETDH